MQAQPAQNNMAIVNAVRTSGSMFANPDSAYGFGIPDLCAANLYLSGSTFVPGSYDTMLNAQNPFSNSLDFTLYVAEDQDIVVRLYDMQGRIVVEQNMFAAGGALNYYTINELNTVTSGVYVLQVTTVQEVITKNVVKNKQ
jgi:hypothetical protein